MAKDIWWIDPARCLLFLILPIYVLSAWIGGPLMSEFGSANFLTPGLILTGAGCILCLALGCKAGEFSSAHILGSAKFDPVRFDRALLALTIVAILAHLLLIGNVLRNPQAMLAAMQGQQGAIYDVKDQIVKMVGVTSLVNITPLVLAMASCRKILTGRSLPHRWAPMFMILAFLVLARGFAAAERAAIVEAAIAYMLPLFSFGRRQWKGIGFFPLIGIAAVFLLFAVGEYTRSWPYYIDRYDNFFQFATLRLLGYISVASNTAAGLYDRFGELGYPFLTATWATRLPALVGITISNPMDAYFAAYGNAEYNNPGGVMASVIDYGPAGGLAYCLGAGAVVGWFYGKYKTLQPVGLLGYPACFIGIVLLTQAIYWGDPKFLTLILAVGLTLSYVATRKERRIKAAA